MDLGALSLSACSFSPTIFHANPKTVMACRSATLMGFRGFKAPLLQVTKAKATRRRGSRAVRASGAEAATVVGREKWLLEPVGDGNSKHIGSKVPLPDAFVITSSTVTVGRLPEKADVVIPVATVSGLHARIQKKEGSLLVTDLGSTNGTFIDEKQLVPGNVATALPGSRITFGDTNLAIFRVSKLENVDAPSRAKENETTLETATATPISSATTTSASD